MTFNENAWLQSASQTIHALLPEGDYSVTGDVVVRRPGPTKTRMGRYLRVPGYIRADLTVLHNGTTFTKPMVWDPLRPLPISPEQLGAAMAGMVVGAMLAEEAVEG